jgi:hypothetical protein
VNGGRFRSLGALAAIVLAALLWADGAEAKMVTVGPPLPLQFQEGILYGCDESCVLTNTGTVDGASDVSPIDGVILRWHLYAAIGYGYFRLRVLSRQGQSHEFLGGGRSDQAMSLPEGPVDTFPAHLPIKAGQMIGLELENEGAAIRGAYSPGANPVVLEPATPDGVIATPPPWWSEGAWGSGLVFPFNAEILPVPTVAGVSSTQGPSGGGNQISIGGENFAEVTGVSFGSIGASYNVDSETTITATVPAGSPASSVPVTVTTAAGRSEAPVSYTYESSPASVPPPVPVCRVPKLKGRHLTAVRKMLARNGCQLGRVRKRGHATPHSGRVKKQVPRPETVLPSGGKVEVTLATARSAAKDGTGLSHGTHP